MAELSLRHRQIVDFVRDRAGLRTMRGNEVNTDDWRSDDQIAAWATDAILEAHNDIVAAAVHTLPKERWAFTYPASTERIALHPPKVLVAHPLPPSSPSAITDLVDETRGASWPVPIDFVDASMVRNATRRGMINRRVCDLSARINGTWLEMLPFPTSALTLRMEYVAYPEAVEVAGEGYYRGLPVPVLRACLERAAGELLAVRKDPRALVQIANRREEKARRAARRSERTGPTFCNFTFARGDPHGRS